MSSPSSSYVYSPLAQGEIRLLTLLPGKAEEPICCLLNHHGLSSVTNQYEALSYMWGSQEDPKTIQIRSQQSFIGAHSIPLGQSLWKALRALRKEAEPRILWADAICINQKLVTERNMQVQMMRKIFQSARLVLVWLGDETDETYEYPAYGPFQIRHTEGGSRHPNARSLERGIVNLGKLEANKEVEEGNSSVELDESRALDWMASAFRLCHKRYWKRLWVIQEILSARELVICYDCYSCPWNEFVKNYKAAENIWWSSVDMLADVWYDDDYEEENNERLQEARVPVDCAVILFDENRKNKELLDLPTLLIRYGDAECKNPRDRVYGLLGLASDCQNGELTVDYDLSMKDLFDRVMVVYDHSDYPSISQRRLGFHLRQLLL